MCVCSVYIIVILSVFPAGGVQGDRKPELTKGVVSYDLYYVDDMFDLCVDHVDLCVDPIDLMCCVLIIQSCSGDNGPFLT